MILNTFGFPCDPGTLNDWMKDPTNGGFKGKDVQWRETISRFSNRALKISESFGDGLKEISGKYYSDYIPPVGYLDLNLNAGYPAVAQIWN